MIIGAGPAGVVAAETLRKCDPKADIAIIGDEPEPPYSRMAIPYLLVDNIEEPGTYLRDPNKHFKDLEHRSRAAARRQARHEAAKR